MVLKIIDNTNTKILEKYGFKYDADINAMIFESYLEYVIYDNGIIHVGAESDNSLYTSDLVVLYKLIKDGLVEVVNENNFKQYNTN